MNKSETNQNEKKFINFVEGVRKLYCLRKLLELSKNKVLNNYLDKVKNSNCSDENKELIEKVVKNFRFTMDIIRMDYKNIVEDQEISIEKDPEYVNSEKYDALQSIIDGNDLIFNLMDHHIRNFILHLTK